MAAIPVRAANGAIVYLDVTGAGTSDDPYVFVHALDDATITAIGGGGGGGGDGAITGPLDRQADADSVSVALSTEDAALLSDLLTNTTFGAVDFATGAKQDTGNSALGSIDTKLPTLVSSRVPVDASGVAVPVTDNGSTLSVDDGGSSLTVDGTFWQATQPISGTVTANLGTIGSAATETTLAGVLTTSDFDSKAGSLTETAPSTDTASSGLNGRLQRIAQRLTSLIALVPSALGQGTMAQSFRVVLPSDQGAIPVTLTSTTVTGTVTIDSELPAAAALADAESNPTAPAVASHLAGYNGATWDRVRVQSFGVDMNAVAITSIATVWTPTSGKKFRLMGGSFSVSAVCSVLFEDNSAGNGTIYRTPQLLANTPYNFDLGNGKLSAATNNLLKCTASTGTVTITGTLRGTEES